METEDIDRKIIKAKSVNSGPQVKEREPNKRKSFNVNEAVKSLDLALGRLKKSKLVNGECVTSNMPGSTERRTPIDMYMDVCPSYMEVCPSYSTYVSSAGNGPDSASMMSMNFSQYELVRNLSNSNCHSDEASSSTTCSAARQEDDTEKDEHLEKFFRSAELWTQRYREGGPSNINLNKPKI